MNKAARFLLLCIFAAMMEGCSPDVNEISDIALVTAAAIDYDMKTKKYTFTSYCVMPSNTSKEQSGSLTQWVSSASGNTLFEAGRKMRSHAGKNLIFQHNKFFIVSENAARHSLYEVVDFLSRKREIRVTAYPIITKGQASDKLKLGAESGDLVSNDLLGQIRNNKLLGQSATLTIKDFANLYANPDRGFVSGQLILKSSLKNADKVLLMNGGAVVYKEKFVGWLKGNDVLVVNLLSNRKSWGNLQFPESIKSKSDLRFSAIFHVTGSEIHSGFNNGSPKLNINLTLTASVEDVNHATEVTNSGTIVKMEYAAAKQIEKKIRASLDHFQKVLKVDIIGFSDYFFQHHPKEWKTIQRDWENIYPSIPIQVHVSVKIEKSGMITSVKEKIE
ncbi:Ger(x)C family spore germination protein [Paenibacillus sp. Soil787]|uniref:Ger(x)C family spore germination protein n=1 Tax=Paenibacillus sp. Soil787 TaxID=1736411 RepID=UPI0006F223ED|nr:Ger(x)C family spore germination protein [Paenibacillus sp. Soil787]KRF31636.1 hypothetical protein ASG93_04640 [Paenibacillus sp. Soil787]